jgi:hypothetical protein
MDNIKQSPRLKKFLETRYQHVSDRIGKEYQEDLMTCPPITQALIDHLEFFFQAKQLNPTSQSFGNELMVQHGCELVIKHLRLALNRQQTGGSDGNS